MKNLLERVGNLRNNDGYVMDTPYFVELYEKVMEMRLELHSIKNDPSGKMGRVLSSLSQGSITYIPDPYFELVKAALIGMQHAESFTVKEIAQRSIYVAEETMKLLKSHDAKRGAYTVERSNIDMILG